MVTSKNIESLKAAELLTVDNKIETPNPTPANPKHTNPFE